MISIANMAVILATEYDKNAFHGHGIAPNLSGVTGNTDISSASFSPRETVSANLESSMIHLSGGRSTMKLRNHRRIKVLCISDYFSPGYKGGGPIRTLENMVEGIGDRIEFWIFTRDRDLGSATPYENVHVNNWNHVGKARVYYASPEQFGARGLRSSRGANSFDVTYVNSFFSPKGAIIPLLLNKYANKHREAIVLAPRGEFSKGALEIKRTKKLAYITLAKIVGLCRGIHWQASSQHEADDIVRVFPSARPHISIAPDVISPVPIAEIVQDRAPRAESELSIAFVSRISAMKNLGYLLDSLSRTKARISLSIYGPIEDQEYWNECVRRIQRLPSNVTAEHLGSLTPEQVTDTFARHDLFAFPTLGENFGHVIFESLRAGTPVLISDQTPWNADPGGAVTVRPLDDINAWAYALEEAARRNSEEQQKIRIATIVYANRYLIRNDSKAANLAMFERAVSGCQRIAI